MTLEIPYRPTADFLGSLTIEHPENCTIEIVDNQDRFHYLSVYSKLGMTYILQYGPIFALGDEFIPFDSFPSFKSIKVGCTLEKMSTNTKAIEKCIRKFIGTHGTEQARLIDGEYLDNVLNLTCEPITNIFRRVRENDTRTNN